MEENRTVEDVGRKEEDTETTIEKRIRSAERMIDSNWILNVIVLTVLLILLLHQVFGFSTGVAWFVGLGLGLAATLLSIVLPHKASKN